MKQTIFHIIMHIILLVLAGLLFLQDDVNVIMFVLCVLLFFVMAIEMIVPKMARKDIYESYLIYVKKRHGIGYTKADGAVFILLIIPIFLYLASKTYLEHMIIIGSVYILIEFVLVFDVFAWNESKFVKNKQVKKYPTPTLIGTIVRFIPKLVIGGMLIINAFALTENGKTAMKDDTTSLITAIVFFAFAALYFILLILTITTKRFKFKMANEVEDDFDDEYVEEKDPTYYDYN